MALVPGSTYSGTLGTKVVVLPEIRSRLYPYPGKSMIFSLGHFGLTVPIPSNPASILDPWNAHQQILNSDPVLLTTPPLYSALSQAAPYRIRVGKRVDASGDAIDSLDYEEAFRPFLGKRVVTPEIMHPLAAAPTDLRLAQFYIDSYNDPLGLYSDKTYAKPQRYLRFVHGSQNTEYFFPWISPLTSPILMSGVRYYSELRSSIYVIIREEQSVYSGPSASTKVTFVARQNILRPIIAGERRSILAQQDIDFGTTSGGTTAVIAGDQQAFDGDLYYNTEDRPGTVVTRGTLSKQDWTGEGLDGTLTIDGDDYEVLEAEATQRGGFEVLLGRKYQYRETI